MNHATVANRDTGTNHRELSNRNIGANGVRLHDGQVADHVVLLLVLCLHHRPERCISEREAPECSVRFATVPPTTSKTSERAESVFQNPLEARGASISACRNRLRHARV